MHYLNSIATVLFVGLVLGAGLPAVFATGLLAYSYGAGGEEAEHLIHKPNPALKLLGIALFVLVGLVVSIPVLGFIALLFVERAWALARDWWAWRARLDRRGHPVEQHLADHVGHVDRGRAQEHAAPADLEVVDVPLVVRARQERQVIPQFPRPAPERQHIL